MYGSDIGQMVIWIRLVWGCTEKNKQYWKGHRLMVRKTVPFGALFWCLFAKGIDHFHTKNVPQGHLYSTPLQEAKKAAVLTFFAENTLPFFQDGTIFFGLLWEMVPFRALCHKGTLSLRPVIYIYIYIYPAYLLLRLHWPVKQFSYCFRNVSVVVYLSSLDPLLSFTMVTHSGSLIICYYVYTNLLNSSAIASEMLRSWFSSALWICSGVSPRYLKNSPYSFPSFLSTIFSQIFGPSFWIPAVSVCKY